MRTEHASGSRLRRAFTVACIALGLCLGPRALAHAQSLVPAQTIDQLHNTPPTNDDDVCAPDETEPEAGSWIGLGLTAGVLNLPKLGLGAEVLGELRLRHMIPIELGATYWFENDKALSLRDLDLIAHPALIAPYPPGGSRLHVQEMQASAALCPYEFELDSGSFLACGGASAGILRASGDGFVHEASKTRPLFQLDLYARWHFRIGGGVGITYSAGLFLPFFRDRFGYDDRFGQWKQQFRMAPLGGRLDLALSYGF